jgi:hypothetical protein
MAFCRRCQSEMTTSLALNIYKRKKKKVKVSITSNPKSKFYVFLLESFNHKMGTED